RWFGVGLAYRHHFNQQDRDSFKTDESFTTRVVVGCLPTTQECTPVTISNTFTGIPPGFQPSSDPHGFIVQVFAGRRHKRVEEKINQPANVTALNLSDTNITTGCPPGKIPDPAVTQTCNESTSISVTTTAVDPENDVLTYQYTVSAGRIVGTGANV